MSKLNEAQQDLKRELENTLHDLKMKLPGDSLTMPKNMDFGYGGVSGGSSRVKAGSFRAMFNDGKPGKLDDGDFKSSGEFLRVATSGQFDPRIKKEVFASMSEGTPSSGGFSVPTQYSAEWLDASLPTELVRNLCKVYPMTSETLIVPGWDGADMSNGYTHGGLKMSFLGEGSTATPQTPKVRNIQLTARMAGVYVDASIELVQDGTNFENNLRGALQKSIGYGIDRYLLSGSGAGCPSGILNSACKIEVEKETGQVGNSLIYENFKQVFARQLNPDSAVWLFSPTVIPELLEISVSVGTGGSHVPLLNETDGKFSIFGRPCHFHPVMKTLGDAGDVVFVDIGNFYAMGLRSEVWIDTTDAIRWLERERSFRILLRFDGMCTLDTAIVPENGDLLSPVVVLKERA